MASAQAVSDIYRTDGLPSIRTSVNYAGNIQGRPCLSLDNSQDPTNIMMDLKAYDVTAYDARPIRDKMSLDVEGVVLIDHVHAASRAFDRESLERDYGREMAPVIQKLVGASAVLEAAESGLIVRMSERTGVEHWARPAGMAHLDYSTDGADKLIADYRRDGVEVPPHSHYAIYQTWRMLAEPPQDSTLAVTDRRSVVYNSTIDFDVVKDDGDINSSRLGNYSDEHRWYYFSNMNVDEVLVFKSFDSAEPEAWNTLHTAIFQEGPLDGFVPRRSMEVRFIAFFE